MDVPVVTEIPSHSDRIIVMGSNAGQRDWYKTALLNTLIALKPNTCLEIGTHRGGTTNVFYEYFRNYNHGGWLITADIKKYVQLSIPHVRQVLVCPHSLDVGTRHSVDEDELLRSGDSVKANTRILRDSLHAISRTSFDFAFIDGDHARDSALKDTEIAASLLDPPHYMLLDDTKEGLHEVSQLYNDTLVNLYEHYDFENWPVFVGVSLIWEKG